MNLAKYTGSVVEGEYPVQISNVEATVAKSGNHSPMLKVTGHFIDLDVDQSWNYILTPAALWRLNKDLAAANVLRPGDDYADDPDELAAQVEKDLSDRTVIVKVSAQQGSQFMNYSIIGVSF
ncbi:MAG: hypothetical protein ACREQ5_14085 [Candidatus Dormibacteria bacterium]